MFHKLFLCGFLGLAGTVGTSFACGDSANTLTKSVELQKVTIEGELQMIPDRCGGKEWALVSGESRFILFFADPETTQAAAKLVGQRIRLHGEQDATFITVNKVETLPIGCLVPPGVDR